MKKDSTMTFLEVLIAIVIVDMILFSIFAGINFASKYAKHNNNKTMAVNFAQALAEEIKDEGAEDYIGYNDEVNLYQSENANITAERDVNIIEEDNYYEVTVTAVWNWYGIDYEESIGTIVQKE